MPPTPKGYIHLKKAIDVAARTLYGPPEEASLVPTTRNVEGVDPDGFEELDPEVMGRNRSKVNKASDWLRAELLDESLDVECNGLVVPAEYWGYGEATWTLSTGFFLTPSLDRDYAPLTNHPCLIERTAFERRLSEHAAKRDDQRPRKPPKQKGRRPQTLAVQSFIDDQVERFWNKHKRTPTLNEFDQWLADHYSDREGTETGFPDFDEVIYLDKRLAWVDSKGDRSVTSAITSYRC